MAQRILAVVGTSAHNNAQTLQDVRIGAIAGLATGAAKGAITGPGVIPAAAAGGVAGAVGGGVRHVMKNLAPDTNELIKAYETGRVQQEHPLIATIRGITHGTYIQETGEDIARKAISLNTTGLGLVMADSIPR